MQLGLCIELPLAHLPFEQRVKVAAHLGFKNIEMFFVDMSFKGKPGELAKIARDNSVTITNTVVGSSDGAIGGGMTNPANRAQWLKRAEMTFQFNQAAGIAAATVVSAKVTEGLTHEQMHQSVMEGLEATLELAQKYDINLFFEALNSKYDHPGHLITAIDEAGEVCRKFNTDRLKLLFDCYHVQITEGELVTHLRRNIDVIGHIHAGGVPDRHEIYDCEINYLYVIEQIKKLGYQGVFSLEYHPTMDHEESLKRTLKYLGKELSQ